MALICDTGVLFAALDRHDRSHELCAQLLREAREVVVVPAPVIVELDWLSESRHEPRVIDVFLRSIEDESVFVVELDRELYARIRVLCSRYAQLHLGVVDASVVAVAERLEERRIATLDHRHFTIVRPRHARSFELLPQLD